MNIYDVSKKADVSIATVSRVINGNTNVSAKTKAKVLAAIEELNYTPNVFARGLGLNTMQTIGIMCTDSSDTYLANAVYFLETELRRNGYNSILCCTGDNPDIKRQSLDLLINKRVDAIMLVGSQFVLNTPGSDNDYIHNAARNLPIVLVNGYLKDDNIFSVMCDDKNAVYNATKQLIENGRRDIIYLYTSTSVSGQNKISGYRQAMDEAQLYVPENFMHLCTKNITKAKDYLSELYENNIHFDAVVTSDDSLAVGALKFTYEYGISVPDELSIIGYNNSVLSRCTQPELTSIDSKVEQLSTTAVTLLMKVLNGETVSPLHTVSADLIKRNTTNF